MATRSNSNRGVSQNSTNGSALTTGRNFVNNTSGMIPGLTKGETYGTGTKLKKQIKQGGPLPSDTKLFTAAKNTPLPSIDRPTEKMEENIMTGAQTIQPGNFTVSNAQNFPIARPGTEYKNSDMVSAYVQSGFNDDILNILIRTT
jgi:hypothetical protein